MFGDAFSPYLIGALSDSFKPLIASSPALDPYGSAVTLRQSTMMDRILTYELTPQEYDREFRALEYSLFSCCFFQVRPLSPLHNVYIVQFFSLSTERGQAYLKILLPSYHSTYICPNSLG